MKAFIIPAVTFLIINSSFSQQPILQWIAAAPVGASPHYGSFCIDSSGNVFMSGPDSQSPPGISIYKFSASGQFLWNRRNVLGGGLAPRVTKLGCDSQGNVYIAGYDDSYFLIKYSSNGILRWVKRYDGVWLKDMEITQDGFPIVAGTSVDGNPLRSVFYTVKVNPVNGDTVWTATYFGPIGSENEAMDESAIISLTGVSFTYAPPDVFDILTVKYNSNGTLEWARTYGDAFNSGDTDWGRDVVIDLLGNIITVGYLNNRQTHYPYTCT
ncbi:MAG: hypothetical protein N2510_05975, partial [Ignavibacteria bacterium]|nr:hypothetical protein [Ignavibacteria bacterium]